jgi:hypothetical protein
MRHGLARCFGVPPAAVSTCVEPLPAARADIAQKPVPPARRQSRADPSRSDCRGAVGRLAVGVILGVAVAVLGLAASLPTLAQAPITATPLPSTESPALPAPDNLPMESQPQRPNVWLPRGGAVLQALDKVNTRSATLSLKVGQTVQFQTLAITLRACRVRPPDQPADAAAYVEVTDSRPGWGGFRGWLLQSSPALSMLEHPIYDLRVAACEG